MTQPKRRESEPFERPYEGMPSMKDWDEYYHYNNKIIAKQLGLIR